MEEETDEQKHVVFRSHPAHPPLFDQPHPYLAITHGRHLQRVTFYNVSQGRYYTKIIPELRGKLLRDCGYGWMYVEDFRGDSGCCFLNIATMEEVTLPPLLEDPLVIYGCIISSPSSDPNCRVMFYKENCVVTCKPGDESFIKLDVTGINGNLGCAVTMFQGKIYGMVDHRHTLVVADLNQPSCFKQVQLDQDSQLNFRGQPPYLIESCGQLLLVRQYTIHAMGDNLRFKVFLADFTKMKWVRLNSIRNRVIFLNHHQGWSCSTAGVEGVVGNSIYFTYLEDRNMYVFSLDDQSITIYLPCSIVSSTQSDLNWIMVPKANQL